MDNNILITSISKKVPLIKAVKKAVSKLGSSGKVVGSDSNPECIGRYFCDNFWHMPLLNSLTVNDLIKYCTNNNISCIIPTRDGELCFFAEHKKRLLESGLHVMVSDVEQVGICLDKLKFSHWGRENGFTVIDTALDPGELHCKNYVIKERFGAGSDGLFLNVSGDKALLCAQQLKNPIFQPHIPGKEVSIDLYIDLSGRSKGAVVRNRVLVVNGESQITETVRHEEVETVCSKFAEKLGLYGHVVFQAIIGEQGDLNIIECNSRFGGASSLSVEVGLDSFYWFMLESRGNDISENEMSRSTVEKIQIRYPEDLIIDSTGF